MFKKLSLRIKQSRQQRRLEDELQLVRSSNLFDQEWYLQKYPDVAKAGIDPLSHYLDYGGFEGRNPGPNFYSRWYLAENEDVRKSGMNPLLHFLKHGRLEGRKPSPPVLKLRRMYDYSKQTNSIIFEESPEQIYLQRPRVVGYFHGELNEGEALCPRPYVSVLGDALIFGGRSLVVAEDKFVLSDELVDYSSKEFGKTATYVEFEGDDAVMLTNYKKSDMRVKEGILLSSGHDANYFHWLVECLPKLLLVDSLKKFRDVPLLIPAGLHPNLLAALERVNSNNRPVITIEPETTCRVDHLIFPSELSRIVDRYEGTPVFNKDIVLSHKWLASVSQCLKGNVNYNKRPWRKLFLTRRKGYRLLGNWKELELLLLQQGFEMVDLHEASLDFQVELFSQAAMIVAPTGAALTNMLFCQPGTKVIVIMSNHEVTNVYFWSNLGAVNNLNVTTVAGERLFKVRGYYSVHDDYVVEPDLVLEEIENSKPIIKEND